MSKSAKSAKIIRSQFTPEQTRVNKIAQTYDCRLKTFHASPPQPPLSSVIGYSNGVRNDQDKTLSEGDLIDNAPWSWLMPLTVGVLVALVAIQWINNIPAVSHVLGRVGL